MKRIRILYDVSGWAYYWRALALQKYAPPDYQVDIGSDYGKAVKNINYDLILQLAFSYIGPLQDFLTNSKIKVPVISSYNVGWGYANEYFKNVVERSQGVIVNNYEMWDKSGRHPKTIHISNGVDRNVFSVNHPINIRKPRVLSIGSIFHRKVKNYDTILLPLANKLRQQGIFTDFRLVNSAGKTRMDQKQMVYWYNTGTVYVVSSTTEGTPNPAIEAASCGCTLVSTKVGNMPELIKHGVNGYLCEQNVNDIYSNVLLAIKNYQTLSTNMQVEISHWDWKERSKQYFAYFDKIINEYKGLS